MVNKPRFVLDTNVIISAALLRRSVARQAFDKALKTGTVLLSLATLEELNNVLRREKFEKYVHEEERLQFLAALVGELAVSGQADCIISGDDDLLTLNPFQGIRIVTPSDFLVE